MQLIALLPVFLAATTVSAAGCKRLPFSSTKCADGVFHYYDADDGQICDLLDCGGGRAPPKTTEPCCGNYSGTLTCDKSPKFIQCFGTVATSSAKAPQSTMTVATTTLQGPYVTGTVSASAPSGAQGVSSVASATPSSNSGTAAPATTVMPGSGNNSTLSTSPSPPKQTGNAANGLQYNALAVLAGAYVALI